MGTKQELLRQWEQWRLWWEESASSGRADTTFVVAIRGQVSMLKGLEMGGGSSRPHKLPTFFEEQRKNSGEITQSSACQLGPQRTPNKLSAVAMPAIPVLGRWGQTDAWGLLTGQPCLHGQFQAS